MAAQTETKDGGTKHHSDPARVARARDEYMTVFIVGSDTVVVEGDSGERHILDTVGSRTRDCSCPDSQKRRAKCKHREAWERWLVDEVQYSAGGSWVRGSDD